MVKMAAVPGAGKSCRCPVSIESGLRDMKRIKLTVAYDGTNYCGWQEMCIRDRALSFVREVVIIILSSYAHYRVGA